jgi:hypothetical protein
MIRQLTKEEKELTEKGIKRQEEVLNITYENLEYLLKQKSFIEKKWEFEDYARPFDRKAVNKDFELKIKDLKEKIEHTSQIISISKDQIKNGVKVKDKTKRR